MSPTCPTCGNVIDPVRAPVAKIVGGKIVTYCSKACADGQPVVVAAAAAAAAVSAKQLEKPNASPAPVLAPRAVTPRRPDPDPPRVELDDDRPRTDADRRRRRNRRALWLAAGIVTGGMAVAVIQAVSPASPAPVDAGRDVIVPDAAPAPRPPAPQPPGPPALDLHDTDAVRDRAESDLRDLLPPAGTTAKVTRIQREAAIALSRTGDHLALEVLVRAMQEEDQGLQKLAIAYALARGGDARGTKELLAALKGPRDPRAEAATYLAELGDQRGAPVLENMLDVSQLAIGAAVALAPLHDKRAIVVLQKVRADQDPLHREDRWRALVALGRAGVADVSADLRAVLDDKDYEVGAAVALARLGDRAAIPVLESQLDKPSLQVGAALGLRRLTPDLDPAPYLPTLLGQLDAGKDTANISAAQAILILTGPANLAEHD